MNADMAGCYEKDVWKVPGKNAPSDGVEHSDIHQPRAPAARVSLRRPPIPQRPEPGSQGTGALMYSTIRSRSQRSAGSLSWAAFQTRDSSAGLISNGGDSARRQLSSTSAQAA